MPPWIKIHDPVSVDRMLRSFCDFMGPWGKFRSRQSDWRGNIGFLSDFLMGVISLLKNYIMLSCPAFLVSALHLTQDSAFETTFLVHCSSVSAFTFSSISLHIFSVFSSYLPNGQPTHVLLSISIEKENSTCSSPRSFSSLAQPWL